MNDQDPTVLAPAVDADATQLAWSADPVVDYPPTGYEHVAEPVYSTAAVKVTAAALAVLAGAATVLLLYVGRTVRQSPTTASTTVTVAATPAPVRDPDIQPAPPMAPEPASPTSSKTPESTPSETPDQQYVTLVTELSDLIVEDPAPIIAIGHAQCDYLSQVGNTMHDAASGLTGQYSGLTPQMAYGIISAAVTVYCPWVRR